MLGWEAFGLAQLHFPNDSTDSPGEHSAVYFIPRVEAPELKLLKSLNVLSFVRKQRVDPGDPSSRKQWRRRLEQLIHSFRTFLTFCSIFSDLLEAGATRRVKNSNLRMDKLHKQKTNSTLSVFQAPEARDRRALSRPLPDTAHLRAVAGGGPLLHSFQPFPAYILCAVFHLSFVWRS